MKGSGSLVKTWCQFCVLVRGEKPINCGKHILDLMAGLTAENLYRYSAHVQALSICFGKSKSFDVDYRAHSKLIFIAFQSKLSCCP